MSNMRRMARGIFRSGAMVSSERVVTESKPRKEKQTSVAADNVIENETWGLKIGSVDASVPNPMPPKMSLMERMRNAAKNKNWKAMRILLRLAETLMPTIFTTIITILKAVIHNHTGTCGNCAFIN